MCWIRKDKMDKSGEIIALRVAKIPLQPIENDRFFFSKVDIHSLGFQGFLTPRRLQLQMKLFALINKETSFP